MTAATSTVELLRAALHYAASGWRVFPCHGTTADGACTCGKPGCTDRGKHPRTAHGLNDATTDPVRIKAWWQRWPQSNVAIAMGASGLVGVDVDVKHNSPGADVWHERKTELGDELENTTIVETPTRGFHLWYRTNGTRVGCDTKGVLLGEGVDIKGEGGYLLAPPSSIAGIEYSFVPGHGPERLSDMSPALAACLSFAKRHERNGAATAPRAKIREGERDDTLFRDACAMRRRNFSEAAIEAALLKRNAEQCDPALPESQVRAKVASSAKYAGTAQDADGQAGDVPCDRNGWLVSDGKRLLSLARVDRAVELLPWANFDPRVIGVTIDHEGRRSYLTDLVREEDGIACRLLLEAAALGNLPKLNVVLAAYGCSIVPPTSELHRGHEAGRLLRFLDAQDAATYRIADALGWHEDFGFLTHEGVITASGFSEHLNVVPDPMLANRAPYRYSFGDEKTAIAALRELLTLHDETVCSVVGSWLVACLLSEMLHRYTKHFPDLGLEGSSGSGKTTGPFGDLLQLITGNTEGPCEATAASLRDRLGAHRSAPVWIDDVSNTDAIYDLLRQAASGGSRLKMAADNTHLATTRLCAPIMVSGEHLGPIHEEKAMMDRFIVVEVPSPVGLSPHEGSRQSRFDELMDLRARHDNDFTSLAGNIVQLVLQRSGCVDEFRCQRDDRLAREADKMAVLRVGALILSRLTSDEAHTHRVEAWIASQDHSGNENILTFEMIPKALRAWRLPASAAGGPPAFHETETGTVWFSDAHLSDWWHEQRYLAERDRQLGSKESIRQQRKALGIEGRGASKAIQDVLIGGRRHRLTARYHALPVDLSARVLERSGLSDGDHDEA
jgi:Bifunctional DNA primase/polymerase, N-terminal/Primase C terminal 1 (PriCT-1)